MTECILKRQKKAKGIDVNKICGNSASIAENGMNTSPVLVWMLQERTGYHALKT